MALLQFRKERKIGEECLLCHKTAQTTPNFDLKAIFLPKISSLSFPSLSYSFLRSLRALRVPFLFFPSPSFSSLRARDTTSTCRACASWFHFFSGDFSPKGAEIIEFRNIYPPLNVIFVI
jgi:hypothetical protein